MASVDTETPSALHKQLLELQRGIREMQDNLDNDSLR